VVSHKQWTTWVYLLSFQVASSDKGTAWTPSKVSSPVCLV